MDDQVDQDSETALTDANRDIPRSEQTGRYSISPRLTYLLIGGAALGLIVLMCLVVALIAGLQSS